MQSYSPTACHFEIITHPLLLSFPLYVRNLKIKYIAIFRLHTPILKILYSVLQQYIFFLKIHLIIWVAKCKREREVNFKLPVHFSNGPHDQFVEVEPRSLEFHLVLCCGDSNASTWVVFCCFVKCFSRELYGRWSSQDSHSLYSMGWQNYSRKLSLLCHKASLPLYFFFSFFS